VQWTLCTVEKWNVVDVLEKPRPLLNLFEVHGTTGKLRHVQYAHVGARSKRIRPHVREAAGRGLRVFAFGRVGVRTANRIQQCRTAELKAICAGSILYVDSHLCWLYSVRTLDTDPTCRTRDVLSCLISSLYLVIIRVGPFQVEFLQTRLHDLQSASLVTLS
jgi:hypothetical protein